VFNTYFVLYYIIKNNFVLCAVSKKSDVSLILRQDKINFYFISK